MPNSGENKSKLLQGIIIGAVVGGCISLLDKNTRNAVKNQSRQTINYAKKVLNDPNRLVRQIQDSSIKLRESFKETVDDVTFIYKKVQELSDIPLELSEVMSKRKQPKEEKESKQVQ